MPSRHLALLSDDEKSVVLNAPVWVTLLVAGADNDLSAKEINWAKKVIHYRTFTETQRLHEYYEEVSETFEEQLSLHLEAESPLSEEALTVELGRLNDILPKLDKGFAEALVKSLRSLAKHIAEADGGLLGFSKISLEERRLVELPMISF